MKIVKYQFSTPVNRGTADDPKIETILATKFLPYSENCVELAKKEAYNGEYTIEDDGEPEPAPSQLDRIEAQADYTALVTERKKR